MHAQPNEEEMKEAAANFGIELPEYKCVFIPATNWLTKNVIKFPPIETEDFYIYGSHEEKAPKPQNWQSKYMRQQLSAQASIKQLAHA